MLTIAYLANEFPSTIEPYVIDEIREFRRREVRVIAGGIRKTKSMPDLPEDFVSGRDHICLHPIRFTTLLQALVLIGTRWGRIAQLIKRILLRGNETLKTRFKALLHTAIGAYYAAILRDRAVEHIHAKHGYFGAWVGMTAARLLGVGFSMTLYGSDLLIHRVYLDEKLRQCRFCFTISEYNRSFILQNFPDIDPKTVVVARLGVEVSGSDYEPRPPASGSMKFTISTLGRLHVVKNHAFLIKACARLRDRGVEFECLIAGQGPERQQLEWLIRSNDLQSQIALLGYLAAEEKTRFYHRADLFVLTSVSEGIPLVLMEAMACGSIVLAPRITGIPELVSHERTGFLYEPGNIDDFVEKVVNFRRMAARQEFSGQLQKMRDAARMKVLHDFNRQKNLHNFADLFLKSISPCSRSSPHESAVLQQVQLSL